MSIKNDKTLGVLATQVWQVDDTPADNAFVDETADANSGTSADWTIFTGTELANDYVAIGSDHAFNRVTFDNAGGTAGTVGVVVWEYLAADATWKALANVVDGTTGFTAAVADGQVLTFDAPSDWASMPLNAVSAFYIRARITTVYTVNPIYDQVFIGAFDGLVDRGRVAPGVVPNGLADGRYVLRHASLGIVSGAIGTWRLILWDPATDSEVAEIDTNTAAFYWSGERVIPTNSAGTSLEVRLTVTGQTGTVRVVLDGKV